MSTQKLENLIEESQSLSQEEKLSLAERLLSDISRNKNSNLLIETENRDESKEKEELARRCKEIHPAIRPGNPVLASKVLDAWTKAGVTEEAKADWEKLKKTIDANRDSDRKLYE